jgi:hypothetical protein
MDAVETEWAGKEIKQGRDIFYSAITPTMNSGEYVGHGEKRAHIANLTFIVLKSVRTR